MSIADDLYCYISVGVILYETVVLTASWGGHANGVIAWEKWAWAFTQAMKLATILFTDFGTFYLQTTSAVTVVIIFE